jgi:hypothetical protein
MKLLPCLILLACFPASPLANADGKAPAGVEAADQGYVTADQIGAMPPRKARLEERGPCYAVFRTADGKEFSIGSPVARSQVVEFIGSLKEGESYRLPEAFLEFQKTSPAYETAERIGAMPPCKAIVEHVGVSDARLVSADGKMFFLGGAGAAPQVVRFLESLKHGASYEFPAAFTEFQKRER